MKRMTSTLRQFLEKQELLRIAYEDRGQPRVVPVWFVTIGSSYYIGTGATSPKWKAMQREPRVGWAIDGGKQHKYKGASMYGDAEEVTDQKLRARIYRAFGKKYFGSADDPRHVKIWGEVDEPGSVFIHLKMKDGFWWELA
jgi:nitroimidazol reductase NimA-like FMN-containing flavoprotein (pyridoxamine 5'-phosphate oxidase superfamily)